MEHQRLFQFVGEFDLLNKCLTLYFFGLLFKPEVIEPTFTNRDDTRRTSHRFIRGHIEYFAPRSEIFASSAKLFLIVVRLGCMYWVKSDGCIHIVVLLGELNRALGRIKLRSDDIHSYPRLSRALYYRVSIFVVRDEIRMRMCVKISHYQILFFMLGESYTFYVFERKLALPQTFFNGF